jgi:hypothetical protein
MEADMSEKKAQAGPKKGRPMKKAENVTPEELRVAAKIEAGLRRVHRRAMST